MKRVEFVRLEAFEREWRSGSRLNLEHPDNRDPPFLAEGNDATSKEAQLLANDERRSVSSPPSGPRSTRPTFDNPTSGRAFTSVPKLVSAIENKTPEPQTKNSSTAQPESSNHRSSAKRPMDDARLADAAEQGAGRANELYGEIISTLEQTEAYVSQAIPSSSELLRQHALSQTLRHVETVLETLRKL